MYSVAPGHISEHVYCKSDLSNPACARLSAHCLCSVDLGQEDLVVLNLTSGIAAAAVGSAAPLCDSSALTRCSSPLALT